MGKQFSGRIQLIPRQALGPAFRPRDIQGHTSSPRLSSNAFRSPIWEGHASTALISLCAGRIREPARSSHPTWKQPPCWAHTEHCVPLSQAGRRRDRHTVQNMSHWSRPWKKAYEGSEPLTENGSSILVDYLKDNRVFEDAQSLFYSNGFSHPIRSPLKHCSTFRCPDWRNRFRVGDTTASERLGIPVLPKLATLEGIR